MLSLGIIRCLVGDGRLRGSGLGFLALRFGGGSGVRERIGVGGKGGEVCVHISGLWGWE